MEPAVKVLLENQDPVRVAFSKRMKGGLGHKIDKQPTVWNFYKIGGFPHEVCYYGPNLWGP